MNKKLKSLLEEKTKFLIYQPGVPGRFEAQSNKELLKEAIPLLEEIVKENWSNWQRPYYQDEFIKYLKSLTKE